MKKSQVILDIECYRNYFLALFYNPQSETFGAFERTAERELDVETVYKILNACEIVTFNGNNYDMPVLGAALKGFSNEEIRDVSDLLIVHNVKPWKIGYSPICDHVDLIEVAPGMASLKIYGGRLACPKLQDLPIEPNALLSREQMDIIREYCKNDVRTTAALLGKLSPQIELRRTMSGLYGQDLRSKSDAQIAEAVIISEIEKVTGRSVPKARLHLKEFLYEPPSFLVNIRPEITEALSHPFKVKGNGVTEMPEELAKLKITIGGTTYQMGMGGLHSTEKSVCHKADEEYLIADWDVASYYPNIILNCGLYPPSLGENFLTVYRRIVEERLKAKHDGDKTKADTLKIVVNGSFGKLGSMYSKLYAPNLMVQVTVTGQLALLMLIDWLESQGISVVSGNTDGIVIKCPRSKESLMVRIIALWEKQTGFEMERSDYTALYSRDVNNYIAVKPDGKVKTKGCYSFAGLQKNPQNEICNTAVIDYVTKNVTCEQTIRECKDLTKFLTVRKVTGGAVKDGVELGKAVRWYYGKSEGCISYKTNGNKVARSEGAVVVQDIPEVFPKDVDYEWYERECRELLNDMGVNLV